MTPEELRAIYYCISCAMDQRDEIVWETEEQYWRDCDAISGPIHTALKFCYRVQGVKT